MFLSVRSCCLAPMHACQPGGDCSVNFAHAVIGRNDSVSLLAPAHSCNLLASSRTATSPGRTPLGRSSLRMCTNSWAIPVHWHSHDPICIPTLGSAVPVPAAATLNTTDTGSDARCVAVIRRRSWPFSTPHLRQSHELSPAPLMSWPTPLHLGQIRTRFGPN